MDEQQITIEGPGPLNPLPDRIDWTKPLESRDGSPVHIYAIDHCLEQPVIGKVLGDKSVSAWSYNGHYFANGERSFLDLRNVPEVKG